MFLAFVSWKHGGSLMWCFAQQDWLLYKVDLIFCFTPDNHNSFHRAEVKLECFAD